MADILPVGSEVAIWVGIRLQFGYPERGTVKQYIPDYPFGPAYEVVFSEGDIPSACFPAGWVFPVRAAIEEADCG